MTKGAKHLFQRGTYQADFSLTDQMGDHFVAWEDFKCSWRGQKVSWCPDLKTQLAQVTNIGVGTAFPGVAAKFHVEIQSIQGASRHPPGQAAAMSGYVDLAAFDGT